MRIRPYGETSPYDASVKSHRAQLPGCDLPPPSTSNNNQCERWSPSGLQPATDPHSQSQIIWTSVQTCWPFDDGRRSPTFQGTACPLLSVSRSTSQSLASYAVVAIDGLYSPTQRKRRGGLNPPRRKITSASKSARERGEVDAHVVIIIFKSEVG